MKLLCLKFFSHSFFVGNHGSQWQKAVICLPVGAYGLAFIGTIGASGQSDLAIDNVVLSYDPTICYDATAFSGALGTFQLCLKTVNVFLSDFRMCSIG